VMKVGNLVKIVWNSGFINAQVGDIGVIINTSTRYGPDGWFDVVFPKSGVHALHTDEMEVIDEDR